jgi:alpha-L-fucosidase
MNRFREKQSLMNARKYFTLLSLSLSLAWNSKGDSSDTASKLVQDDAVAGQHQQIGVKSQEVPQPFRRNGHPDAQWFPRAGFGLFIHWGISSVDGRIDLSWGMMTNTPWDKGAFKLTPNQYFALAERFQPDRYDPHKWLKAAKEAGFQYVVLTTRHHDGYALWPSKVSDFSTATHMRGRDLVRDYVEACRDNGLKVGLYYSPPDWHYNREWMAFNWRENGEPYLGLDHQPMTEPKRSPEETKAWDRKYKDYIRSQVEELLTRYGRIDLLWFDGGPEAISIERIRELQPGVVVNPRMHGHGDFTTAEVGFPKERPQPWWEMCAIWNGAWGYLKQEQYVSTAWMLEQLSRVRSWGGNYLINIGPRPNGELPDVAYERFRELGAWMKTNGVAVLDVEGGPWPERCNVPVTTKGKHFYFLAPPHFNEPIVLKASPKPRKLTLMGSAEVIDAHYENEVLTFQLKPTQQSGLVDVVDMEW